MEKIRAFTRICVAKMPNDSQADVDVECKACKSAHC